jgi:fibronectin type 3 domain-containing protein
LSAEVSGTPSNTKLSTPAAPGFATADREVTLTWADMGATNYEVYWRTAASAWHLIGTPATNSFTDIGLTNGETYYYAIAAVDANGSSAWSPEVWAVPNP